MAAKRNMKLYVFMRTHPGRHVEFHVSQIHRQLAGHDRESRGYLVGRARSILKPFIVLNVLLSLFTLLGALFVNRNRRPEAVPHTSWFF